MNAKRHHPFTINNTQPPSKSSQTDSINIGVLFKILIDLMGRENNEPAALDSIALLQERFRQLQRAKEMREERELIRVFAGSESPSPESRYKHQTQWFIHPDLVRPSRPLHGHGPPTQGNHTEFQAFKTSTSMSLRSNQPVWQNSSNWNEADVDTSLHL